MNNNGKKPAVSGKAPRYFQFFVVLLALFWAAQPLSAEDLQGSKDFPFLKRFAGSEIVGYQKKV